MTRQTARLSWKVRLLLIGAALIPAFGATVIGLDLHAGLGHGAFSLVRGRPVTLDQGSRYWLLAAGETLSVLTLGALSLILAGLAARRNRTSLTGRE